MRKFSSSVAAAVALLSLNGCYSEQGQAPDTGDDVAVAQPEPPKATPTPSSTPTPAPAPVAAPVSGTPISVAPDATGIRQLASIPSNFDASNMIVVNDVPTSADPDVVGAFRFTCEPSHLSYDDPIIYPGQKGRAHLHQFFGNTKADANSTYESLRTTGDSTCANELNRSAYWIPAMMNGFGQVVLPSTILIYYKRFPASSPECKSAKGCMALPRGLRYVFGRTMQGIPTDDHVFFYCDGGSTGDHFRTIPEAAKVCPAGASLIARAAAPDCWDGVNLDSPDHRSHMAYPIYVNGVSTCPSAHPYRIPRFEIGAMYKVDGTLDRSGDLSTSRATWHFSSDRMEGMTPQIAGSTYHADWFGAWDDGILKEWTDHCIDRKLSCSWGNLGNGRRMLFNELSRGTDGPLTVAAPPKPVI